MLIEAKDLIKEYISEDVKTAALSGVSFRIAEGEFVAIMGPSGSGKSTLMHIMSFLDRPSAGVYKFKGKSIDQLSDEALAKARNKDMGFVFQSYNLLPRTTVFDNVKLPLIYAGIKRGIADKLVKEALTRVGLAKRIHFKPNQLSGGEQQRVAIARALVNKPAVIFADEPTGNLDSKSGNSVMALLQDLNEQGHTIVLVTHEKYTSEHAERIIRLADGKLVADEKVSHRVRAREGQDLMK